MTRRDLIARWVGERLDDPDAIVDLLLLGRTEQVGVLRAYADAERQRLAAELATLDAKVAEAKAERQADADALATII